VGAGVHAHGLGRRRTPRPGRRRDRGQLRETAEDPARFLNRKAELWWQLRNDLQPNEDGDWALALHVDDVTKRQIGDPKRHHSSSGKIQIESKDDMEARGVKSPDRAEAIALSRYNPQSLRPKRKRRGLIAG
jgi:hypothetical protein